MLCVRMFLAICVFMAVFSFALATRKAEAGEAPGLTAERLRCEYQENPLGIDAVSPRLSWTPTSDRRGAGQKAYRILVASSEATLASA